MSPNTNIKKLKEQEVNVADKLFVASMLIIKSVYVDKELAKSTEPSSGWSTYNIAPVAM